MDLFPAKQATPGSGQAQLGLHLNSRTEGVEHHFRLIQPIGLGPCGGVCTAVDIPSNRIVAVKVINIKEPEWHIRHSSTWSEITREARAIKSYCDNGISAAESSLAILKMIVCGGTLWISSPLCSGGNLKTLMEPYGCLSDKYLTYVLRDLACALLWTHSQGSFHGNLKCSNILVDDKGRMRLCDFSLAARGILSQAYDDDAHQGSLHWLAPECLPKSRNFEKPVDIWGFGAVAWEAAVGRPPFDGLTTASAICDHLARSGPPVLVGDQYPETLKELITSCFTVDPTKRPSVNFLMAHSYMNDIEVRSLQGLVDEYRHWQVEQAMAAAAGAVSREDGAHAGPMIDDSPKSDAGSLHGVTEEDVRDDCQSNTQSTQVTSARNARNLNPHGSGPYEATHDDWRTAPEADSVVSYSKNPSRCSSPFDLEYLIQEDVSPFMSTLGNMKSAHRTAGSQAESSVANETVSVEGGSQATGMGPTASISAADEADWIMKATLMNLELRFSAAFNPDFDIFAPESVGTDSGSDIGTATTSGPMLSPSLRLSPLSSPSKVSSESLGPSLWDGPAVIQSQMSTSTDVGGQRSCAPSTCKTSGAGTTLAGLVPPFTFRQRQNSPVTTADDGNDSVQDDDDTSTVRPRDSQRTSICAPTRLFTPPATPDRSTHNTVGGTDTVAQHWPRLRLANSSYDLRSANFSPPQTPGPTKPLPPLPSLPTFPGRSSPLRRPATSQHRPSTSGGSNSSDPGHSSFSRRPDAPPVPPLPLRLRRPSVDIFSPVNWQSSSPCFNAEGNYIAPQCPLLNCPNAQEEANHTPDSRQVGKSKAVLKKRMIPREAGSCPPRRRKSHPTRAALQKKSTSALGRSDSPPSSSQASERSSSRPPPRNASFSFFPSQSSSVAANAAAAARTATSSSAGTAAPSFAPRRPSAPLPTQQSFFDYDADDSDDDGAHAGAARRAAAGDIKRGVKRLVHSVSANLGDTFRGLETAPVKGLRWMKRHPQPI